MYFKIIPEKKQIWSHLCYTCFRKTLDSSFFAWFYTFLTLSNSLNTLFYNTRPGPNYVS